MTTGVPQPYSGKKSDTLSGHEAESPLEKHARIARASLYDLIAFYDLLEEEMSHMMAGHVQRGESFDNELYDKMVTVKDKYLHVMRGLADHDYHRERHTLIDFADAVQDLMAYVHLLRRH